MKNPVIARDQHTYERERIRGWISSKHAQGLAAKSPMNNELQGGGADLQLGDLMPNIALKAAIDLWVQSQPRVYENHGVVDGAVHENNLRVLCNSQFANCGFEFDVW